MPKEQQESQVLKFSYYRVSYDVKAGTAGLARAGAREPVIPAAICRAPASWSLRCLVKRLQRSPVMSAGRAPVHQPGDWRGSFTRAWKIIDMCQRGPGDVAFKARRQILVARPELVILLTFESVQFYL